MISSLDKFPLQQTLHQKKQGTTSQYSIPYMYKRYKKTNKTKTLAEKDSTPVKSPLPKNW